MASRSSELETTAVRVREVGHSAAWIVGPSFLAGIEAARRLAGAHGADLLRVSRATGQVLQAMPAGADPVRVDARLRAAVEAWDEARAGDREFCWFDGPAAGEATLLARVAEQASHGFHLVLRIADEPAARARTAALIPDLALLLQLCADAGERLDGMREARDAAVQALDQGECGIIAVRADHSLVFANTAARVLLAAEAGLHVRRGMVRPTSLADAIRFREALERVIDPPLGELATGSKAVVMLLSDEGEGHPPIVVIAPAQGAREGRGAAAIITVHRPTPGAARGLDTLCRLHGLSKVEGRLMTHLMAGLTITEAAGEMHIKVETARTYLKQMFVKTGVHRQTDLVSMMARYARALRGPHEFVAA